MGRTRDTHVRLASLGSLRDRAFDALIILAMLLALITATRYVESRFGPLSMVWQCGLVGITWITGVVALWLCDQPINSQHRRKGFEALSDSALASSPLAAALNNVELSDSLYERLSGTLRGYIDGLERRDEQRRELVAHVAHDLKSPLASVRGYIERMIEDFDQVPQQERQRYLSRILESVSYLSTLITQLLELSRLEMPQFAASVEPFPLDELLEYLSYKFRALAEQSSVRLNAGTALPKLTFRGDRFLLERALSNIIENAIRYNHSGGSVDVKAVTHGADLQIEITDSGVGISPRDIANIFEPFYRGVLPSGGEVIGQERTNGTGLGLAIAKKIVELHRGELRVSSIPGTGSTFTIRLPH